MRLTTIGFLTAAAGALAAVPGFADDAPAAKPASISLIGIDSQVILRSRDVTLKVGKVAVPSDSLHRVFRVARVRDDWLWVVGDGVQGWAKTADVIPFDQADAYFSAEIAAHPADPWAYQMRGLVRYDQRNYDGAAADDSKAIALAPKDPVAYHNRGNAWLAKRNYDRAIKDYNQATTLDPADTASYANRALAWFAKREYDLAIADDNEAIRLNPADGGTLRHRALAWAALKEYDQALADYDAALKLDAKDATALTGRAWVRATAVDPQARDGKLALDSAERACKLTDWKEPFALGTLAAAEAEVGHFEAAVKWQTKALALFPESDPDQQGHRLRLALYQDKKPYRDDPGGR